MTYSTSLPNNTHDIVLADDHGVEVGLISVDARGEHDPTGIVRTPVERSSLKMSQGNQSYSDLEPPYTVLAQSDWSGGRGGQVFETDVTRFSSSCRADTGRSSKIILCGRETYGTGYRKAFEKMPGSMQMLPMTGGRRYMRIQFHATAAATVTKLLIWLAHVGTPAALTMKLYYVPTNTLLQTATVARTQLQTSDISEPFVIDLSAEALTHNDYIIDLYSSSYTTASHWKVGVSAVAGSTQESADGATWTASAYDIYYRVMDNEGDMSGKFFQYADALYFITKPATGHSHLWKNTGDVWADVTPAAITEIVTDVVVSNRMVIFAQGAAGDIVAMRKSGETLETIVSTGQHATYLAMYNEGEKIILVKSHGTQVASAVEPVWGKKPTWVHPQQVGFSWESITGLVQYVNDSGSEVVWVMKESGPWEYDGETIVSKGRNEMRSIATSQMGRVAARSDVYLFFSVMNTIWRYYSPTFDDVGFMLDEGLPADMRGNVSAILAYPGRTLVAVNAGVNGYSCILENNGGSAWHEKYRAPKGERIFAMELQVKTGTALDKLWIRQEADFLWVPYPSNVFDPKQDSAYPYQHEGVVELGTMFAGMQDAWKYWSALKMQLEDLEDNTTWVEADYRLEDGAWVTLPSAFTEMPMEEKQFGVTDILGRTFGVSSKKFQLRVRLYSVSALKSPVVRALIVEAVTVNQPKFTYSFIAKIGRKDLNNAPDETLEPYEKMEQLDTWSGTAQSLWMRCINPLFDGKPVFLSPLPNRPLTVSEHENEFDYTTTITLQEA